MILNLIGIFGGFLVSSILDTTLGEFSEWAIVGAALVVATVESFNNFYYFIIKQNKALFKRRYFLPHLLDVLNYFKIGIIYGFVVDAFKLGS